MEATMPTQSAPEQAFEANRAKWIAEGYEGKWVAIGPSGEIV
jgi:hypothetical protein